MNQTKIGLIGLIHAEAERDFWGAMRRVAEIGYQGVESPGGGLDEQVELDGVRYLVYSAKDWGSGWTYVAFARDPYQMGAGTINLVSFLSYMRERELLSGEEYVASIELGSEVVSGKGEALLSRFAVSVH